MIMFILTHCSLNTKLKINWLVLRTNFLLMFTLTSINCINSLMLPKFTLTNIWVKSMIKFKKLWNRIKFGLVTVAEVWFDIYRELIHLLFIQMCLLFMFWIWIDFMVFIVLFIVWRFYSSLLQLMNIHNYYNLEYIEIGVFSTYLRLY